LKNDPTLVAVDLGAESCRVSLLRWTDGVPATQIVHRFPNGATESDQGLRWDIQRICQGVEEGLVRCAGLAPEGITAVGVDGWAVDYVRLNGAGKAMADPFCYRDSRNAEAFKQVHARISPERLYALTGVQILPINTLYQLSADSAARIDQATPWTNLPEYVLSYLGGSRVAEFTNATHTALLECATQQWCKEIFDAAGLEMSAAPPVAKSGTKIGQVRGSLAALPAFRDTGLIAPACHDTASAIAGIPAHGDDWAFISSGTWSLVGSVLDEPCLSEAARQKNFSNEGGIGGKTYFLKNVNGMWLLRQCMEHWQSRGASWTVNELIEACESLPAPRHLLDVDDPDLLLPGNMPARIHKQLTKAGHGPIPEEPRAAPQVANLIFHSLASRYASVLRDLTAITGKSLKRLYIVGGGGKNAFLNRLTAKATGLEVFVGATEGTTIGNFAIQMAALSGEYEEGIGVDSAAVARWAETIGAEEADSAARHAQSVLIK